jgi:protein TonB
VDVDLGAVTRERALADAPPAGGADEGVSGTGAQSGGVYAAGDRYVEKAVVAVPGSPQPRYPETLRQARVEGEVEVEFVVDTLGRVERGSLRILRSDHELFAAAVRAALPGMRFLPAEAGGRRVRQLVRQPFSFAVR